MRKQDEIVFQGFIKLSEYSVAAAAFLETVFADFDRETLAVNLTKMHDIEHAADMEKHHIIQQLTKESATVLEREDVMMLLQQLDNVVDIIEDVLRKVYMYNVSRIPTEAQAFATIISDCCESMLEVVKGFRDAKKDTAVQEGIVRINTKEEEGDRLHLEAVRKLHEGEEDTRRVYRWTKMFDALEDCCDACEDVSDAIEMIMLKRA